MCLQYDELVPSTMRTKYGGFYINTGELDFVPVEDASLDGKPLKKKMKKVRSYFHLAMNNQGHKQ